MELNCRAFVYIVQEDQTHPYGSTCRETLVHMHSLWVQTHTINVTQRRHIGCIAHTSLHMQCYSKTNAVCEELCRYYTLTHNFRLENLRGKNATSKQTKQTQMWVAVGSLTGSPRLP